MNTLKQKKFIYYYIGGLCILSGCGPAPPPPPIFTGLGWLIILFVIFLVIFLWEKHLSHEPLNTKYLTESLNAIEKRMRKLEQKIEQLEEKQNLK